LVNVYENFSSVSSTLDLNTPSVLTDVWGMSSWLVQVTVAPTGTLIVCGPKTKLSIFTSAFAEGGRSLAVSFRDPGNRRSIAISTGAGKLARHKVFFVIGGILSLFSR
jgi:hypothetical protein